MFALFSYTTYLYLTKIESKIEEENKGKFKNLFSGFYKSFDDFWTEIKLSVLFNVVTIARDAVVPLIVVTFIEFPVLQVVLLLILFSLKNIYNILVRPFKSIFENIVMIASDIIYQTILAFYFTLLVFRSYFSEKLVYYLIGNCLIFCFALIILLNISLLAQNWIASLMKMLCISKPTHNKIKDAKEDSELGSIKSTEKDIEPANKPIKRKFLDV